jgi:hypothetical protein
MIWVDKVMDYFSRKFVLALAALCGSFALSWAEKDVGEWAAAIAVVLGFYNGSNVYQKYLDNKAVASHEKLVQEKKVGEE